MTVHKYELLIELLTLPEAEALEKVKEEQRCDVEGCSKVAIDAKAKCAAHGGGKRCDVEGCIKVAIGATAKCAAHGGGKRKRP